MVALTRKIPGSVGRKLLAWSLDLSMRKAQRRLDELIGFNVFLNLVIFFMAVIMVISSVFELKRYEIKAQLYAYDLRSTGAKVQQSNIVFISVKLPDGRREVFNTNQHAFNCPFIDTHTPIVLKVTETMNVWSNESWGKTYDLKYHPCKLKNKL